MDITEWTKFYNRNFGTHMFMTYACGTNMNNLYVIDEKELGFYWNGNEWDFFNGYLFFVMKENAKQVSYKVEYYKDNVKSDEETITTFIPKTQDYIKVDKTKINTVDKYDGYTFKRTNPEVMPEKVYPNQVIKVYYEKKKSEYMIYRKYYIDGECAATVKGVTKSANIGDIILAEELVENNPDWNFYTIDGNRLEFLYNSYNSDQELIIGEDNNKNIITLKYVYTTRIDYFTVNKTSDKAEYDIGEEVIYTIEIDNSSKFTEQVKVMDKLDEGLTFASASDGGEYDENTHTIVWEDVLVPANGSKGVELCVKPHREGEISNKAEIYLNEVSCSSEETMILVKEPTKQIQITKEFEGIEEISENFFMSYNLNGEEIELTQEVANIEELKLIWNIGIPENIGKLEFTEHNAEIEGKDLEVNVRGDNVSKVIVEGREFLAKETENPDNWDIDIKNIYKDRYTVKYIDGADEEEIFKDQVYDGLHIDDNTPEYKGEIPTRIGYLFSGWSPEVKEKVREEDANEDKEIIYRAIWEKDETQTKELSYKVEYYKDGIKADEEEVKSTVQVLKPDTIKVDKNKVDKEKYTGYKYIRTEPTEIPEEVNNGDVIKVYYEEQDKKVIVKYVDKVTGEEISEQVEKIGCLGEEFDIKSEEKEIEGYELLEEPEAKTGVFKEEVQIKTYYYGKKTTVTVKYLEKNTEKELLPEETIKGHEGEEYNVRRKDIDGYVFVERPANAEGTMTADPITVIFYYVKVSKGVIEKHIDINSNYVLHSQIHEGNEGDPYEINRKDFEGYDIVESKLPTNSKGVMTAETIEVKYYYIRRAKVVVEYLDRETNKKIASDARLNGHEGDAYTTEQKAIKGYEVSEVPKNNAGTMTKEEIKVTYYYKKIPAEVVEKHIDVNTNKVLETKTHTGHYGDTYKTEKKDFEGYDIVESKLPTNSKGTMTEKTQEVVYYYARKVQVLVQYLEKGTEKELLPEEIIKGHEGEKYKAEEKKIEGYKLLDKPENAEGTMKVVLKEDGTVETIYVKYYYEKEIDKIEDNNKGDTTNTNKPEKPSNTVTNNNENITNIQTNIINNNTEKVESMYSILPNTGDIIPTTAVSIIIFVVIINIIQSISIPRSGKGKRIK